jgi:DNA helicase-2/ATP-dependent DNA helicase PcrA
MAPELNLLDIRRGSVSAPAGCGKTQLIATTLASCSGDKPVLILTHTNAGLAALRKRLAKEKIHSSTYKIATIDGFAMKIIKKFPLRSGHDSGILQLNKPSSDYPEIRSRAATLLQSESIDKIIEASYSNLLVDEYQDCNIDQHKIVVSISRVIPVCVLGDPMQAIFDFRGNTLVDWGSDVLTHFPEVTSLKTPWRWNLAGCHSLGAWLLASRNRLKANQSIDLRTAPSQVEWIKINNAGDAVKQRLFAARTQSPERGGAVLIIGDSINANSRYKLTSQTPGATAVEKVDLEDLVDFARYFDPYEQNSLAKLLTFSGTIMTGVGAASLIKRIGILRRGKARTPPSDIETAALKYLEKPDIEAAARFIRYLSDQPDTRVYRPDILHCCLNALETSSSTSCGFYEAALKVRERNRHIGRSVSRKAVGSTLLLKGLEADVVVILYPEAMTAQNLYVALTRGAKKVVICSESHLLKPMQR